MGGGGSVLFTEIRDFEVSLPGKAHVLVTKGAPFRARLTWMELRDLLLLHARETFPRVAFLSLPADRVFAFFPTEQRSALICDGTEIRAGEIVLYIGARTHHRTLGPTRWSAVAMGTAVLRNASMILAGSNVIDLRGMVLRPIAADWRQLLKLHAEAIRTAETRLPHIDHPEVARALEQDLIWALVNCLTSAEVSGHAAAADSTEVLSRFETCLMNHSEKPLSVSAICRSIHVSERTLRALCSRVLGMSPGQYRRLRTLDAGFSALPRPGTTPNAIPSDSA